MHTSTEIPIMSGIVGCDKYSERKVIRVQADVLIEGGIDPNTLETQVRILQRNLGERFIKYEMTGTAPSNGGTIVNYEYRYWDIEYYIEAASIFQLFNILRANPFWILGKFPNFEGVEVIGFMELD